MSLDESNKIAMKKSQKEMNSSKRLPADHSLVDGKNLFYLAIAIGIRLIASTFSDVFKNRVELKSPTTSFGYLQDGIAMLNDGVDPYSTKQFNYPPIILHAFNVLTQFPSSFLLALFIALDVSSGLILSKAAEHVSLRRKWEDRDYVRLKVLKLYLFNPITVISCGILSLSVIYNFLASFLLYTVVCGFISLAAITIGIWSSLTLYPSILLCHLTLHCENKLKFIQLSSIAIITFLGMNAINYCLNKFSWSYIDMTYLHTIQFTDFQPNTGLYWYLFVQVFEHFRNFYIAGFSILFFFMPIPLTLSIRKDRIMNFTIILLFVLLFYPYPTLNFASTIFAILPLHLEYKKYFRYTLLIAATLCTTIVLMPVMWHMWIVSSSGNANFFFAAVLFYNIALINIAMDLIFVYHRRQIDIEYGDSVKKETKFSFDFY